MAEARELFISYRSTDRALAQQLYDRLTAAGFTVWFDVEALDRAGRWRELIEQVCEQARIVLPVITPHWQSQWTEYETYGAEHVVPLVCAGNDSVGRLVPPALSEWEALDLRQADEATWEKLFRRLRAYLAQPAPDKQARTAGLPFAPNRCFVGREALLLEIHTRLHTSPTSALTHDPAFVLEGLGGIGKTTLARQYAERFWRLYRDLLWVPAGNPDLLPLEFARLALQLGVIAEPSDDPTRDAQLALRELESGPRCLLILDNAEDEDSIRAWLPKVGRCHTLITSRYTFWSPEVQTVMVHVLEAAPARELLLRRSGLPDTESNRAAADALANDLGYLPLALEQAAAYIEQQHISLGKYREDLAGYRARLLDRRQAGGTNCPNSVATTWLMTVEELTRPAHAVLRLLAFFAPDPLPRSALIAAGGLLGLSRPGRLIHGLMRVPAARAAERYLWCRGGGCIAPLDRPAVEDALGELQRYSLIGLEDDGGPLTIHRLLQAVQEDGLSEQEQAAWTARALETLARAFPVPDHTNWQVGEALLPHALAAAAHGERRQVVSRAVGLLPGLVGSLLQLRGQMSASLGPMEQAVAVFGRLAGADPGNAEWQRDLSVSQEKLGDVRVAQGDLAGALAAYQASLDIRERLAAADPGNAEWQRDLSVSHERLGDMRKARGDLGGALAEYERSLQIMQPLADREPENAAWQRHVSVTHELVGGVRVAQGDLPGALAAYQASLDIRERLAAADPGNAEWQRDLAVTHTRLGDVRVAQGDLPGTLAAYQTSHAIFARLAVADPGNAQWQRDLAAIHSRLGEVRVAQGDLPGALAAYQASLDIARRLAAADPGNAQWQRDLSVSQEKLGKVRVAQGDLPGALAAYRASHAVFERLAAADPGNAQWQRDLWVSCWRMADLSQRTGEGDALAWWRRAHDTLARMRACGMHLSPEDMGFLEQLRAKLGSE